MTEEEIKERLINKVMKEYSAGEDLAEFLAETLLIECPHVLYPNIVEWACGMPLSEICIDDDSISKLMDSFDLDFIHAVMIMAELYNYTDEWKNN